MANAKDKIPVSCKLDEDIRDLAAQVARAKGIDLSEHIRSLIIQDLDARGLLATRIRVQLNVRLSPSGDAVRPPPSAAQQQASSG